MTKAAVLFIFSFLCHTLTAQPQFPVQITQEEFAKMILETLGTPKDEAYFQPPQILQTIDVSPYYSVSYTWSWTKYNGLEYLTGISIKSQPEQKGYYPPIAIPLKGGNLADYATAKRYNNAQRPDFGIDPIIECSPYFPAAKRYKKKYGKVKSPFTYEFDKEDEILEAMRFNLYNPEGVSQASRTQKEQIIEHIYNQYTKYYSTKYEQQLAAFDESQKEFFKTIVADKYISDRNKSLNLSSALEDVKHYTTKVDHFEKYSKQFRLAGYYPLDQSNQIYIDGKKLKCKTGDCVNGEGTVVLPYGEFKGNFVNGTTTEGELVSKDRRYSFHVFFDEDGLAKSGYIFDKNEKHLGNFYKADIHPAKDKFKANGHELITHVEMENYNYIGTLKGIADFEGFLNGKYVIKQKDDNRLILKVNDGVINYDYGEFTQVGHEISYKTSITKVNGKFTPGQSGEVSFPQYLSADRSAHVELNGRNLLEAILTTPQTLSMIKEIFLDPNKIDGPIMRDLYEKFRKNVFVNGSRSEKMSIIQLEYPYIFADASSIGSAPELNAGKRIGNRSVSFYVFYIGPKDKSGICLRYRHNEKTKIEHTEFDTGHKDEIKCEQIKAGNYARITLSMDDGDKYNDGEFSKTRSGFITSYCEDDCDLNDFIILTVK